MSFSDLFDVHQTGNRIDLLTCAGRADITNKTVTWWQSQGWQVVLWDNTGYLPAVGRNNIIKSFKESDRQLLIMADDDITLYTHRYLTADWLKKPVVNGVYTLNSNHKMGILKYNSTGWDDGHHHWRETTEISQLYVIADKNIPYQDEYLPALEDLYWAKDCNSQGIKTQILHTVFLREQSQDKGSLLFRDRQHRKEIYNQVKLQKKDKDNDSIK
jgi:hypothetical protein